MKQILCLILVVGATVVATRTWLAEKEAAPAPPPAPATLKAEPMNELAIANPTAVLLGEAKVPDQVLAGTVTPAPNVIVPEIPK